MQACLTRALRGAIMAMEGIDAGEFNSWVILEVAHVNRFLFGIATRYDHTKSKRRIIYTQEF